MGGYGSTRWGNHAKADTTGDCCILSVTSVKHELASIGNGKTHSWGYSGNITDSIWVQSIQHNRYGLCLRLQYTYNKERQLDYLIQFTRVDKYYGGSQVYFLCPNQHCQRRVAKLYRAPGNPYFVCRQCAGVKYRSSQESHKYDRSKWGKALQIDRLDKLFALDRRLEQAKSARAIRRVNAAAQKAGF